MNGYYPWMQDLTPSNYSLANIGQLKNMFSWDLNSWIIEDSDNDALPDYWERFYFNGQLSNDGSVDSDEDGLLDSEEFLYKLNPTNLEIDTEVESLRIIQYNYDELGRLKSVKQFDDLTNNYGYDSEGNIESVTEQTN